MRSTVIAIGSVALLLAIVLISRDTRPRIVLAGRTFRVDIAHTPTLQARGLSGRERLAADEGMLFVFPDTAERPFWMKGVLFAIDIVWLHEGMVVGIAENAQPEPGTSDVQLRRYRPPQPIDMAVELPAGTTQALGIHVGDVVDIARWDILDP